MLLGELRVLPVVSHQSATPRPAKIRRRVLVSNYGKFDPTFNGILIGFQDGRSNLYSESWTMDDGDTVGEFGPEAIGLRLLSRRLARYMQSMLHGSYIAFRCSGSLQGHIGLMLSVIYTTRLESEATYDTASRLSI